MGWRARIEIKISEWTEVGSISSKMTYVKISYLCAHYAQQHLLPQCAAHYISRNTNQYENQFSGRASDLQVCARDAAFCIHKPFGSTHTTSLCLLITMASVQLAAPSL